MERIKIVIIVLSLLAGHVTQAQSAQERYPKGYFQWPVEATVGLAANFGELRPNHYHMGLDCRTDQKENRPVYAAAAGYIAKVKIEPYGFGRAIYVNHPNGLTTLYAHLNNFNPALEKYVTEQQYKQQQWNIFIDIPPSMFPLTKGQLLAYSGNTGGSQGPHTHFEIRDTKTDKVLNPLLFGFPIADHTPPDVIRLAIYDRCISTYEQAPRIIALKKVNGIYQPIADVLINTDRVSFAITSYDRYTGSTNQNGIFAAALFDNGEAVCRFEMDSISYDETRYLNAHIDYRYRSKGGPYLEHLSQLPGYTDGIYKLQSGDGVISLEDGELHAIKIIVSDAQGNNSEIRLNVKATAVVTAKVTPAAKPVIFYPRMINIFENENIRFYLPKKSLYDSFRFRYSESPLAAGGILYHLHEATVPVHTYFPISIRASYAAEDTGKIIMKRTYGSKKDFVKAIGSNGWYTAHFREFGDFQLLIDTIPPVISAVRRSTGRLAFSITDNTEEIINFSAWLDGKWLRFSNNKGRTYIYNFDDYCPPGAHELKIMAEDQAGNSSERIYNFTR